MVDGYTRQVWVNDTGDELIESYSIPDMAHGTPLATGEADEQCGAAGPFLLEVGISSSYHIAKFFGLTNDQAYIASMQSRTERIATAQSLVAASEVNPIPGTDGEVLGNDFGTQKGSDIPASSKFDINAIITKALKAAGLLKGR